MGSISSDGGQDGGRLFFRSTTFVTEKGTRRPPSG